MFIINHPFFIIMKQILLIIFLMITAPVAFSQHIGIGNSNPATSLDVKGAIGTRPDTVIITQQFQTVDVSNTNFIRLDGQGAGQGSTYTILLTPGKDGQRLRMESIGSFGNSEIGQLVSNAYLSNGKKILLADDANFVFAMKGRYIDLFYSDVTGWTETGRNNYTALVNKVVFTNSGNFTVPIGISQINFAVWGAGGYGGGGTGIGGNGGFIAGSLQVNYGQQFNITIAQNTSSGGGFSSINTGFPTVTHIILAGGGGSGSKNGGHGGNAGSVGENGNLGNGATGEAGMGAQLLAGGAGGAAGGGYGAQPGGNGGYLTAGTCSSVNEGEGEGGSGYYGGGGSGTFIVLPQSGANGGGGGGRNHYLGSTTVITHNTHTGNIIPLHTLYDGGGIGGSGSSNGTAGKVVITW